jgi:hypothetical protein
MSDNMHVKLPTFKGRKEDFGMFWTCLLLFARKNQFERALYLDDDLPLDPRNLSENKEGKKKKLLRGTPRLCMH